MTRITPLAPPYEPEVEARLESMMPPGVPPIGLFRTFVRNLPMADAIHGWGAYYLSRRLSLSLRDRELLIGRTCARCGCEYEWGVHVAFFGERAGLDATQVASLSHGSPADPCWADERERVLIAAVDELHDSADLADATWARLAADLDEREILDLLLLTGWYHAISYVATAARVAPEPGAPRFADVTAGGAAHDGG